MATIPPAPLADCHCHIDDYGRAEMPGIVARARAAGVGLIITAGVTLRSSRACVALADEYETVCAGVGLHPSDLTGPLDDATYEALHALAIHPRVVVVSETGLDYLPGTQPKAVQDQAFRAQIRLARDVGLPVVVHSRQADDDTLRVLREEHADGVGVVLHYFQGTHAVAQRAVDAGFHISLAKPLLRLPHLQDVARWLPLERIVLETDAFPQPWKLRREAWTEPAHVRQVAEKLAELRRIPVEELCRTTTCNLVRLLGAKGERAVPALAGWAAGR